MWWHVRRRSWGSSRSQLISGGERCSTGLGLRFVYAGLVGLVKMLMGISGLVKACKVVCSWDGSVVVCWVYGLCAQRVICGIMGSILF